MQQRALDGLELPVDDHHLGDWPSRLRSKMELCPVSEFKMRLICLGSTATGFESCPHRTLRRDEAALAQPARIVLAATLPRLGFYIFLCGCCSHNFVPLQKQSAD